MRSVVIHGIVLRMSVIRNWSTQKPPKKTTTYRREEKRTRSSRLDLYSRFTHRNNNWPNLMKAVSFSFISRLLTTVKSESPRRNVRLVFAKGRLLMIISLLSKLLTITTVTVLLLFNAVAIFAIPVVVWIAIERYSFRQCNSAFSVDFLPTHSHFLESILLALFQKRSHYYCHQT